MIILKEKQKFDEMAIQVVSSREDGLPFRIAIKAPDHSPPHAHVMDLSTGKIEQGQFLISEKRPRSPEDIKDYKQGVTDSMRQAIFDWADRPNRGISTVTNWALLYWEWCRNEKW
jgi:hypothetical protein